MSPALLDGLRLIGGIAVHRPYVAIFFAAFCILAIPALGWRRTLAYSTVAFAAAWLSEYTSTRNGFPFGAYTYSQDTSDRELFISNIPAMASASFVFLGYAGYCVARSARLHGGALIAAGAALLTALDLVIDPASLLGDRWFLGHLYAYDAPAAYYGVPWSNSGGWLLLTLVVVGWLWLLDRGRMSTGDALRGATFFGGILVFNVAVCAYLRLWGPAAIGLGLLAIVTISIAAASKARHAMVRAHALRPLL
jgi:uncharacterized membrane protein